MKEINSEYCVVSFVNQIKPNKKPWFTVNGNIQVPLKRRLK